MAINSASSSPEGENKKENKLIAWVKRLGIAGFIFFLVKGLLWLLIPYLIAKGLWFK